MENIIFGIRPVAETIQSGRQIERLYIKKDAGGQLMTEFKDLCWRYRVRWQEVPVEKLNRMTRGNHQGVVAQIAAIGYVALQDILDRVPDDETPLIVVFDGVTDVRNFGAIARSAECAGAHGLIVPMKNAAPVNAEAVKASAGALNRIPVHRAGSIRNTLKYLSETGMQIVAATEKSRTLIYDADLGKPTVIVMGSEDKGISKEVLKLCDVQLAVPIIGSIESLFVVSTVAAMFYAPFFITANATCERMVPGDRLPRPCCCLKRCASGFTDLGGGTVRNSAACGESQQPCRSAGAVSGVCGRGEPHGQADGTKKTGAERGGGGACRSASERI